MTLDANCAECRQARDHRLLNEAGVCPLCLLTMVINAPNPIFESPPQGAE